MTVAIVVAMFLLIILVDWILTRVRDQRTVAEPVMEARPALQPAIVGGFHVAENVRYHPGHSWALAESPELIRVGIDDLAGRVMGHLQKIKVPAAGTWVRQGQPAFQIERDGRTTTLMSPIEGAVVQVNPALIDDPDLARRDPYGEGWLMTVHAPDAKTSFRNLLGGGLARSWMEQGAQKVRLAMGHAPAYAQDGGIALDDLSPEIPDERWESLSAELFLR